MIVHVTLYSNRKSVGFLHFFPYWVQYCRKLCIHKGVFPREPKKKVKGNHHTYYHLKDVMYILHDPLLEKFREIRAYQKKIKKAKAKKNDELARLLLSRAPSYKLDMVIRDRFVKQSLYFLISCHW